MPLYLRGLRFREGSLPSPGLIFALKSKKQREESLRGPDCEENDGNNDPNGLGRALVGG